MRKISIILRLIIVIIKVYIDDFIVRIKKILDDNSGLSHPVELSLKQMTESIARTFYPAIVEFFEIEENKREFEQWLEKRKSKNLTATD